MARTAPPALTGPTALPSGRAWPSLRPGVLVAVLVGGCIGGLARVAVTTAWPTASGAFPWSTFVVNSSGAFLLAFLLVLLTEILPPTTYVRPLLATGFCGAFTTFSAITVSSDQLLAHGHATIGAVYLLGSFVAGLVSAAAGLIAGRALAAGRQRTAKEVS